MDSDPFGHIKSHFEDLADPRVEGRCSHLLIDIICIALEATICGADGWEEVEEFGKTKET